MNKEELQEGTKYTERKKYLYQFEALLITAETLLAGVRMAGKELKGAFFNRLFSFSVY